MFQLWAGSLPDRRPRSAHRPATAVAAMAAAARAALTAVPIAISIALAACGPARTGAPVPRPFPSPSGPVDAAPDAHSDRAAAAPAAGADFPLYLAMLEEVETGGDCLARPPGGSAIGCYQMTRAALRDAGFKNASGDWLDNAWGVDSDGEFQRNRSAQRTAMLRYTTNNWLRVEPCVRDLIGRTVGGVTLDQAALVSGAHLLGASGLVRFVRCGLRARCVSAEAAASNGGSRRLRANAMRRMRAAYGLRVLASTAGSGSRCGLSG